MPGGKRGHEKASFRSLTGIHFALVCYKPMMRCFVPALILLFGCACSTEQTEKNETAVSVETPVVTDDRTDLILSWFADSGPEIASSVAEVPKEARGKVRVQDPTIPPEKQDTRWIFFANLNSPGKNGRYPVQKELRTAYEAKRQKATLRSSPQTSPGASRLNPSGMPALPPGGSPVIMYATRHCPVCINARRWLLNQKIPYIELDIEKDPKAAAALMQKGKAQGVPTSGVPIFEIRGRLVPGFDPGIITQLLTKTRVQSI